MKSNLNLVNSSSRVSAGRVEAVEGEALALEIIPVSGILVIYKPARNTYKKVQFLA